MEGLATPDVESGAQGDAVLQQAAIDVAAIAPDGGLAVPEKPAKRKAVCDLMQLLNVKSERRPFIFGEILGAGLCTVYFNGVVVAISFIMFKLAEIFTFVVLVRAGVLRKCLTSVSACLQKDPVETDARAIPKRLPSKTKVKFTFKALEGVRWSFHALNGYIFLVAIGVSASKPLLFACYVIAAPVVALGMALATFCKRAAKRGVARARVEMRRSSGQSANRPVRLPARDPGARLSRGPDAGVAYEPLLHTVENGSVAPIRLSYLLRMWQTPGEVLRRRQDLPPAAFWTADELWECVRLYGELKAFSELFFSVLSYCWLEPEHPDPDGFHLSKLGPIFALILQGVSYSCPQLTDAAIFWDFASLHQEPRSPFETELFSEGLKASNIWYYHSKVHCIMQTCMPDGTPEELAYSRRGWPSFEAAISAIIKPSYLRIDVGRLDGKAKSIKGLRDRGSSKRAPPLTPARMGAVLSQSRFVNGSDCDRVINLYSTRFSLAAHTKWLLFNDLGWGAQEADLLTEVLPLFHGCRYLDLAGNTFGCGCDATGTDASTHPSFSQMLHNLPPGLEELCVSAYAGVIRGVAASIRGLPQTLRRIYVVYPLYSSAIRTAFATMLENWDVSGNQELLVEAARARDSLVVSFHNSILTYDDMSWL